MTTATEIQRVSPILWSWNAYEPAVKCELTSHAVKTPEGLILIDPIGLADPEAFGETPAAILVTNAHHARAALWWQERSGARIVAPAAALAELEIAPDVTLQDGEIAPGGFRVVALPGGAPGEAAYVGHGLCGVGDALIHLPSHGFALLPAKYCADAASLPNAVRKLLSYDFHILTFAHGAPLVDRARERLAQLLA